MKTSTQTTQKTAAPATTPAAPAPASPILTEAPAPDLAAQHGAAGRGHRFGALGVSPAPAGAIQPKLTVGAPDDQYEAEADRVAGQVMRMPDPTVQRAEAPEYLQRVRQMPRLQIQGNALQHHQIMPGIQAASMLVNRANQPYQPLGVQPHSGLAPVVQRYIEGKDELGVEKVSEGGNIAMVDAKTVYATEANLDAANAVLDSSQQATFRLARGAEFNRPKPEAWEARFHKSPQLKQVRPVFKPGKLKSKDESTQPVEGDAPHEETVKLAAYREMLTRKLFTILDLRKDIEIQWKNEEEKRKGLFGFKYVESVSDIIYKQFNGKILRLMNDLMGLMWSVKTPSASAVFEAPVDVRKSLRLSQYMALFGDLAKDYLESFRGKLAPEFSLTQLWMTLPNDCKNTAMILTGKSGTDLNHVSNDPRVGDNYAITIPSKLTYGWRSHYATVIMKDKNDQNTDNLTFETAASINVGIQEGKSLGFFEMYGTKEPIQTFGRIALMKNRANVDQQVEADLANANPEEQKKIKEDQAEDHRLMVQHLASMIPLPDDSDDDNL